MWDLIVSVPDHCLSFTDHVIAYLGFGYNIVMLLRYHLRQSQRRHYIFSYLSISEYCHTPSRTFQTASVNIRQKNNI